MTEQGAAYNRLLWRCTHRSLREMDVILEEFLENHYQALSPSQVVVFTELAELEDIELWPLVTGKKTAANPLQAEVLAMLRDVRVK